MMEAQEAAAAAGMDVQAMVAEGKAKAAAATDAAAQAAGEPAAAAAAAAAPASLWVMAPMGGDEGAPTVSLLPSDAAPSDASASPSASP